MFRIKTDIRQYKCETPEKVEKLIRNWVIRPTDLIYHHKNKSWRPIGEHPNFQGIFAQLAEQDTAQGATVVTPQGESVGGGSAGEAGATDAQLAEAMQKVRIKLPPVSSKRLHQTTGRIHLPEDFLSNAVMERPLRRGEKPAEADLVERVAATWQGINPEIADDLRETNELTPEELQAFALLRAEQRAAERAAVAGSEEAAPAASASAPALALDAPVSAERAPTKPPEQDASAAESTPAEEPLPEPRKAPETADKATARVAEPVETPPARPSVPMPPPPAKVPPKQEENFISGGYALDLPFAIGPSEEDRGYGLVLTRADEEELDRVFPRPVPKRRHEVTQRAFTLKAASRRPAASGRVASVSAPGPAPAPADRSLLVVATILAVLVIIIAVAVAAGGA